MRFQEQKRRHQSSVAGIRRAPPKRPVGSDFRVGGVCASLRLSQGKARQVKVLVDTGIWIAALQRDGYLEDFRVLELKKLLEENQVRTIGPIRQEILAGIPTPDKSSWVQSALQIVPEEPLLAEDYETAASYWNRLKGLKVEASMTDALICAIAVRARIKIFSSDKEFLLFQKHLPISMHHV
jgi:predicted nucleic acid-binding protein